MQGASEIGPVLKVVNAIMLTISTAGVLWVCKTQLWLRDVVKELLIEFRGVDGKNGIKSKVGDHERRIGLVEDRFVAIDAIEIAERSDYHGKERRHTAMRKLLEMIRAEMEEERK